MTPGSHTTARSEPDPLDGTVVAGRYLLTKKLGEGGFGAVYLGIDRRLHDRRVVVKFLLRQASPDAWREEAFRLEAAALSRLDHPGIIGVLDQGSLEDGTPFLIMQFADGRELRQLLSERGMEFDRAAHILREISRAVGVAHRAGVIHRDLKPENIMVQRFGQQDFVRVIDFGLARLRPKEGEVGAFSGKIAGSPPYMAPEQLDGKPPARSQDIYAVGVIAYEMLTGRLPFIASTITQLRMMQFAAQFPDPLSVRGDLPPQAAAVLRRALQQDPAQRYPDVEDLGNALHASLVPPAAAQPRPANEVEVAYVLFMDIVGYSRLNLRQQVEAIEGLQRIVAATDTFQREKKLDEVISLPTGDGMALLFSRDCQAPAKAAVQVATAVRQGGGPPLRMGIHCGPVSRISDLNAGGNAAGDGINMAQRVMDCGDEGHILVSRSMFDMLHKLDPWSGMLRELGSCRVKHGVLVQVYSLVGEGVGNPERPKRLPRSMPAMSRRGWVALASGVAVAGAAGAYALWPRDRLTLRYALEMQAARDGKPMGAIFPLTEERTLTLDYRVRLSVRPTEPGHFYVLNEPPDDPSAPRRYLWLFPGPNDPSAALSPAPEPLRVPRGGWIVLDNQQGDERLWMVWSRQPLPALEAMRKAATPQNLGSVSDAALVSSVAAVLRKPASLARRESVEANEVVLKSADDVLVYSVRLSHY